MAEDLKKLVQIGVSKGYSLEKMRNDFANAGWGESYLDSIPLYYNEFKKKSPAGTGLRAAGASPSTRVATPSLSELRVKSTDDTPPYLRAQEAKFESSAEAIRPQLEQIAETQRRQSLSTNIANQILASQKKATDDESFREAIAPSVKSYWDEYRKTDSTLPDSPFDESGNLSSNVARIIDQDIKGFYDRTIKDEKAKLKREAERTNFIDRAGLGIVEAGLGLADLVSKYATPVPFDAIAGMPTMASQKAKEARQKRELSAFAERINAGYTEEEINDGFLGQALKGNFGNSIEMLGLDMLDQVPNFVIAAAAGPAGIAFLGTQAGAQDWISNMDNENMSGLGKVAHAFAIGLTEALTERLFSTDINTVRGIGNSLLKGKFGGAKAFSEIPKKEFADALFKRVPKALRGSLEEGIEEGIVSVVSQTMDNVMMGKEFSPMDIAESFVLGASMGGGVQTLAYGVSSLPETRLFSDGYKIKNRVQQINELLKDPSISESEKSLLSNRLNQYKTQLRQLQDESSNLYKQFSPEDQKKMLQIHQDVARQFNGYSQLKTAEAKAEAVSLIKQSLAEKAQIEQKYDSTQKQQVPSPVVQGAELGGVPVQGTGTETPQAGGVLQVPSQQEEKVVEAAKQPNVGFRPTKAKLTSQTLPQVLSGLKSYVESIPEETLQKFETTRQSITDGFESVANVISSFAKEGLNVEVEAINTEDEWNKATMDPTTGEPQKLSRGLYYQRGQEGAPSKIILFAPALLGNTVYHEGIHEIVPQAFGQEGINKVAKALASGIKRDPGLNAKFGNFLSQYEQGDKSEELLAELGAMVAAGDIDVEITKSLATRFMEAVASVLGAVGIKMAPNSSQLAEALLSYSQKLGAGAKLDIQKTTETKEEGDKKGPKRQAVGLRTKEESLAEFGFPVGDKVTNIRQVGAALEKRQQKKYIKIAKNDTSDKAKDIISNYMVDEVIFELESLGESSAKGWYGEKFQKALDLLSESIPSLKDKGNRNLFTMLVAITSDGQKVINNFTYAISLYNSYLKDGVVSDKFNFGGDRNSGMKINVGNINRLIKQYGNDFVAINDFLLQTDSYGNIKKKYNIKKSDYKVTTTMPISAGVFGPKLGAFFANLSGQENYLTMDRWWSRTFNRYRGILLPTVKEQGKQKFLNAIGKPNISNNAFLKEVKKYADSYIKKKYKNGTAIEKAANTIYKAAFVELNDKPFNAGDRDMMIETTQVAQEKLKKAGYDLSMADIQAILWYFEKRLYAEIQSKKSAMDVDYSNAVTKLIEGKKDLSFLPNEVSKIVNVKESEDEYVDAISSPSSNIIQLDEAVDLAAVDKATETINNAQQRKAPKRQGFEGKQSATFVRELDIAITPATTERKFDKVTARIKSLSEKYDRLVKESEKGIDNSEEINNVASQILDAARKQLAARISKVKGASVKFDDDFRGLYNNVFEPSFNLKLRLTPQSNENEVSQILNEFAERYTQDAFIVETASEESEDFRKQLGENVMPLGDYDEKTNMSHFPQLYAEFTSPLSDKELNELSLSLREGGIDGFSLNKKELKITIFPFLTEEQEKLSEDEQRRIKKEYYDEQISSARKAMANVSRVGRDVKSEVRFRKSTYKGAKSTEGATRQYDRDNFLKAHKDGLTKYELLAKEFNKLRLEEIELSKKKEKLPKDKQKRYDEIKSVIQPIIQDTIALNEPFYKEAKREIERIASSVSRNLRGAFVSRFNIKRPERASIKVMRWYNSDIEDLGDGARVNIIVDNEQQADRLFNEIDKKNPSKNPDRERRVNETTDLGYPKRLIEMDTKNGFIGEIQIMTPEGYLAKDGVDYFDDNQQDFARKRLKEVQNRLGWAIPDGIGHYFYEINRDENINDELRERAKALSLSYYKAFTNPSFKLSESEFTKELAKFKEDVDKADKSTWDEGNSGKSPKTLDTYLEESGQKAPKRQDISRVAALKDVESTAKALDGKFDIDYKNTIVDKLSKFDKQIADKKFPSALEVAEYVLPRAIFNKYKSLYEIAARNNINISNEKLPYGMTAAWAYGNIQLNKNVAKYYLGDYNEFAETLNHEIIHGLISRGIRDNYALNNDLQGVMNSVLNNYDSASDEVKGIISYIQDTRKQFKERDFFGATEEELKSDKLKEVGSLEELITYAFTNKEFADFLDAIPAGKEIKANGNSIFDQLKNIIRNFIEKITKSPTALDEVNSILNKYFDTSWNEKEIANRNERYEWGKIFEANKDVFDNYDNNPKSISEAYHKAKKDGSNPELVKAVEDLLVGEQKQPKRQAISKAQGPSLIPAVYSSLLQESTKNSDGTNTPPYTLQQWLTMMTPYLSAQTATAIYNGVVRNKPPFTAPSIQDAYDSSKKRMEAGKNKAFFTWNNLKKYFIDRQAELKKAILASGMKNAYNYLVNKAGSGARAAYFYYEKEKDIYKDLKKEQIEKLDQIIMLRRIIEIDSNFDERDEARPKHTNGFNKEYAEMELARLQKELGNAAYKDLNDRATKYFDAFRSLLDSMYEEGLVSEELYEQLRDIDYQPRLFLDHITEMDEPSMREMNLSASQIRRIKEGSEGDIMFDSRFLLSLYAKSAFSKIARNKANKEIAKATEAQGNESWVSKTDKPGFEEVTYFEEGVRKSFYLKDNLKSELDDIERVSTLSYNAKRVIGLITGSYAVKLFATRANPLFVAKNIPRDYLHVLFFTDAYDNMSLPLAAMRLAGDFIKGVKGKLQDDQDFKDFVEFGGGMDFLSTEGLESMVNKRTVINKLIEKFGKAGELSEIGFRLAMYKKFKEDGIKALGSNATEDEITRVKVQAVTKAREMIDFSQGGIATKNLELIAPYINSAFQGFRVSTSYIQNNPKEFAIKLGYLSIGVLMLALYNAMIGDDDMEDIPEETKRKYFIIMTPFTFEEDGKTKRHYVKIAKTQQLAPFIAGLELASDYFVAGVMGREPRESKDAYEYAWKGAMMYLPKDPSNVTKEISSLVPMYSAISSYQMNYDTYRERAISMDYNQVLPQDEDFTNKQVPYFYKALAQGVTASGGEVGPKRLQVATEKFVTTPYSSLLTMGAYTILDSFSRLFELKGPGGIPVKDQAAISNSVSKSLGISMSKVFTGATEPDWRSYTRKEEIERINMEEKSERRGIKIAAQDIGQKYFEAYNAKDSKAMSEARSEYQDELMRIRKESGVPDARYFMDAFQQARKYGKATNPEYNDISYAASNEAKARIIMEYGGRTMRSPFSI